GADLGDRAVGHRGDLPGASSPASSIAAVTMSAVVSGSDISRGASRTVTPSTSSPAAGPSPGGTSHPSRTPVPEQAPLGRATARTSGPTPNAGGHGSRQSHDTAPPDLG